MSESLPKIAAFIFFIWLGWFLRRREILKESAFHAVSGLVLYVTIPCIIITNLNFNGIIQFRHDFHRCK